MISYRGKQYPSISDLRCRTEKSSQDCLYQSQQNYCPNRPQIQQSNKPISNSKQRFKSKTFLDSIDHSFKQNDQRSQEYSQSKFNKPELISEIDIYKSSDTHQIKLTSNEKDQQKSKLSHNNFSFMSQSLKCEFDLALHQQISNRIEHSMNNQSKVIAFQQIASQQLVFRIFRYWKQYHYSKQQIQYDVFNFVEDKNFTKLKKSFNELKNNMIRKELQFLNEMKSQAFYQRNKYFYILYWSQAVKNLNLNFSSFCQDRADNFKIFFFNIFRKSTTKAILNKKAKQFHNSTLIKKVLNTFKRQKQSRSLQYQLDQISYLFYRKETLTKAFQSFIVFSQTNKTNEIRIIILRKTLRTLSCSIQNKNNFHQVFLQFFINRTCKFIQKMKHLMIQKTKKQRLKLYLLKKRFEELTTLSSYQFSNDVLSYSIQKYRHHWILNNCFKVMKIN